MKYIPLSALRHPVSPSLLGGWALLIGRLIVASRIHLHAKTARSAHRSKKRILMALLQQNGLYSSPKITFSGVVLHSGTLNVDCIPEL